MLSCPVAFAICFWILKGQVHGSAHAHLSKCRFSARTCCIIYASNMIMSSVFSKNQAAHSPGSYLHVINLHLHLHLHLSRSLNDRWGATDVATLSLHFIWFSASLMAWQNFNPVHSAMLFSQRFFCRPLLLPPCSVPCKIVLIHAQTTLTCVSLPWLRYHHRAQWLA